MKDQNWKNQNTKNQNTGGQNTNRQNANHPNPDDRKDNVPRIQKNIDMTIHNIEAAEDMAAKTSDDKMKKTLSEKNDRRRNALDGMRHEIRDEADAQKKWDK